MGDAWVQRRPAPALRPLIDNYVGYRVAGAGAGMHRGLPSRYLTLIASIGEPIDVVAQTDPRQAPGRYRFVAGGLQARPAVIATPAVQEGVAIELTPLGSRALLGVPAAALWDTSVEAADVMGPAADELWERLHHAGDWPSRFQTDPSGLCGGGSWWSRNWKTVALIAAVVAVAVVVAYFVLPVAIDLLAAQLSAAAAAAAGTGTIGVGSAAGAAGTGAAGAIAAAGGAAVVETPAGAGGNWLARVANNGKGTVWQEPGVTGNANSVRIMDPTSQYPNGYVRFYNQYGQPVGLDGKPGPNSATHIPLKSDGTYPTPQGW